MLFVPRGRRPSLAGMATHHNGYDSGAGAVDFGGRSAGFPFRTGITRVEVRSGPTFTLLCFLRFKNLSFS